jgi:hypothetical protein
MTDVGERDIHPDSSGASNPAVRVDGPALIVDSAGSVADRAAAPASRAAESRPSGIARRSSRIARIGAALCEPQTVVVWLVWVALIATEIFYVARYAAHIPFWDDLEVLRIWLPNQQRTLAELWSLHNEHRIPLPLVIQTALLFLTRDFRSGMYFEIAIFAAISAAMVLIVRRLRGRTTWTDAAFPLVWLHIGNAENLLMGFQISLALPTALVCVLFSSGVLHPRTITTRTAVVCALALVALPLCGGPGLTQTPAYFAGAVALGWAVLNGRVDGSRAAGWSLLAGAAATVVLIALYFVGFAYAPADVHTRDPLRIGTVALSFLTLVFGQSGRDWWPWSAAVLLALIATAVVLCVRAWRETRSERVRAGALLIAMCGTVLLGLGIGHGRGGTPDFALMGFAVRYVGLPAPLLCAIYIATVIYGGKLVATAVQCTCVLWMCAAVPLVEIPAGLFYGELRAQDEAALREAIVSGWPAPEVFTAMGTHIYPTESGFCSLFRLMAENSLDPFDRTREEIRREWMGEPIDLASHTIETPNDEKPYYGDVGGSIGLAVPPGSTVHYAVLPAQRRVHGTFGVVPRKYLYGRVGGLRVAIVIDDHAGPPRTLLERTLDPMNVPADRQPTEFDLELPPHEQADLALRMLPADPALHSGWGYWLHVAIH